MAETFNDLNNEIDILQALNAAIFIIEKGTHTVLYANQCLSDFTGFSIDKIIDQTCNDIICPYLNDSCPMCNFYVPGQFYPSVLKRSDGSHLEVVKSVKDIFFKGKECHIATCLDASALEKTNMETKNLLETLESVRKKMEMALDVSTEGYWEISCEDRTVHLDSQFYTLDGYVPENFDMDLQQLETRIHPTDRNEVNNRLEEIISGDVEEVDLECRFLKSDGEYLWIRATGILSKRDHLGKPERIIGIIRDIDISKKQEERNRHQNELQSLLLIPGPLKTKLREITKTIFDSIEIIMSEIWVFGEEGDRTLKIISGSGSCIDIANVEISPLDSFHEKAIDSKSDFTIEKLDQESIQFINQFSVLQKKSIHWNSLKLLNSDGGQLGLLSIYSEMKISQNIRHYLLDLGKIASQVIVNELSERKFREALQLTEKANRLMEGREIRIRQIKEEINKLTTNLGWGAVYKETLIDIEDKDYRTSDLIELRKNALSMAEDAEIARREAVEVNNQLTIIKHAVNSSGDAIAISTMRGDIFYSNMAFTNLFGYSIEQLSIQSQEALFFDKDLFFQIMDSFISQDLWQGETEMISQEGRKISVLLRSSLIRNENGELMGLIWIYTDITRQKSDEAIIKKDLQEKQALLRKAMILQQSFIQKSLPVLAGFKTKALFLPCENLGGDFFRIIDKEEMNKLIIILGDCTDHGIKASMDASLLTSLIEPLFHLLYEEDRTDLFLKAVSNEYSKFADDDQFPTMFVMTIDYKRGISYYSSANSTLPFLLRGGEILQLDKAQGMHIGYFDDPRYERKRFEFLSGDKILLFSDALLEIEVKDKVKFGYGLMESILSEHLNSGNDLFSSIINDLKQVGAGFPLSDDTTLILLERMAEYHSSFSINSLEEWNLQLQTITGTLSGYDFSNDEIDHISNVLNELSTNALSHEKSSHSRLKVKVNGHISCLKAVFTIEYEGLWTKRSGFSLSQSTVDAVDYNEKGDIATISLVKKDRHVLFES